MSKTRRLYSREFKLKVLREHESGKGAAQVCREHEIAPSNLHRWKKEFGENPNQAFSGSGNLYKENAKIAELERLLGQSHAEIAFLKKTLDVLEKKLQEERRRGELR
jgi:transposase